MLIELLLTSVVHMVITTCRDESEFSNFVYAVLGGGGWEWIFGHRTLVNTVTLPPRSTGPIHAPDMLLEPLVYDAVVKRAWSLGSFYFQGQSLTQPQFPLTRRNVRLSFFGDLVQKLGEQMDAVRFLGNPASGVTLTTSHEGGVTVTAVSGTTNVWELTGDTSANWPARVNVFRSVLKYVARSPGQPLHVQLAGVPVQTARDWFADMIGETGNSCLVGVLVADLKNGVGQITRVVSVSANMCGSRGDYTAHTRRRQGSQIHMEIFLLERLGALLTHMTDTIEEADVAILGLKTSTVVSENSMCDACAGTKTTQLEGKVPSKVKKLVFGIDFLGP